MTMLRHLAATLALTATLHAAAAEDAADSNKFDPKLRHVFTVEHVEAEAAQAKMPMPPGIWTPSESDIDRFEALLLPRLIEAIAAEKRHATAKPLHPADYYRQYTGGTVAGKRVIIVGGPHRTFVENAMQREKDPEVWKKKFLLSTDFGCRYFHAKFEVEAGTLQFVCSKNILEDLGAKKPEAPKPPPP